MMLIISLGVSLFLTLVFELAVAAVWGVTNREDIALVCAANVITNPAVVFASLILKRVLTVHFLVWQLPLEAIAVFVECLIYTKFGRRITHPFAFSLTANAVSYSAGLVLPLIV